MSFYLFFYCSLFLFNFSSVLLHFVPRGFHYNLIVANCRIVIILFYSFSIIFIEHFLVEKNMTIRQFVTILLYWNPPRFALTIIFTISLSSISTFMSPLNSIRIHLRPKTIIHAFFLLYLYVFFSSSHSHMHSLYYYFWRIEIWNNPLDQYQNDSELDVIK